LIVQLRAAVLAAVVFSGCLTPSLLSSQVPFDTTAVPRQDSAVPPAEVRLGVNAPRDTVTVPQAELPNCGHTRQEVQLRRAGVAAVFIGGNAALYSYMKNAWWTGERADGFFFNADWDENFRDQDKFGHALGGYHLARFGAAFFRSACMSKPKATAWSAAYAALFQLQIEIFDAQFEKYGFSYPDLLANTIGTAFAVLHEVHPRTRAIKPLISYAPSAAYRNRANFENELRPSLDYSGQTYWLTADVDAMLPAAAKPFWPGFLRVSAGHSITDWIDPRNGANIRAKRKIVLTIDFDAEKLPGENRIWKTFKRQVGYIHLPSPALQISPNLELIGWYR
jgi:hypothetical protein